MIDPTFLTVHPRTALWWEQREKCKQCRWVKIGDTAMNCLAPKPLLHESPLPRIGRPMRVSCIEAREDSRACGPDAKLFQPKE